MILIAYKNNPEVKAKVLAQLEAHRAADQIVKGQYWEHGKGCAVGCTVHSDDHMAYERRFGIPVMLARLEDCIFEGLPNERALDWPLQFMAAIKPGQDLSLVGWKFQHWLLTDEKVNPGINHPLVCEAVKACADVLAPLIKGNPVDGSAARSAAESARSAAESARSAVWSAAVSARSAASASSASSAVSAAESARSAESAAESARSARSAESASSASSAAYVLMADKLIELIEVA